MHFRDGALRKLVTPSVKAGGMSLALAMPNLVPPVTTTEMAVAYRERLKSDCPELNLVMTLFLSPDLTVEEVGRAHRAGIKGVKSYPRGVTTNSGAGVESYERYYDVFAEMERLGLVLNLHGEVPSSPADDISVLNAEEQFLPNLILLHKRFPKLRIVLEHATSAAAVEAVKSCGPTVACTITVHHLALTIDGWAGQPMNFCKPVAKRASDREALRRVIAEGHKQFFLGSDSAPHPLRKKSPSLHDHVHAQLQPSASSEASNECPSCAAGVYTSAELLPLLAEIFEDDRLGTKIPLERLAGYASTFGRDFYQEPIQPSEKPVILKRCTPKRRIPEGYAYTAEDGQTEYIRSFYAGQAIGWQISEA